MKINYLDATTLHNAFLNACDCIIKHREKLNAINLFPVADGDTGDNMAATAHAVINYSVTQATLKETIQSLADSALLGARGNSGMIFSQFFNGLTETALDSERINTQNFAQLLSKASISVRSAILDPVEGTIITIIDAWSASISKFAQQYTCFKELTHHTLSEVQKTLQSTTDLIPVLKNAQVVDAGALGFYHFICGFTDHLLNPRPIIKNETPIECNETHHEMAAHGGPPEQRYCTEITVNGEHINRIEIVNKLEQFGDSIVSSGNERMCRFHVHCTKPHQVFESLIDAGRITHAKADDMLRQFQMIHQRKFPIALVTDSSADLPQTLLEEHQIHVIHLNMHLDGHNLLDGICVNPDNFYERLAKLKTYPKTSFPSPALIKNQLSQLSRNYEHVLVLPIAKALSGTHDALVKAAEDKTNIHVIDSCLTSAGLGLLLSYTAELIAQGSSITEIKKLVLSKIPKINLFVYVGSFDSMIRSGRISKIGGRIAEFAQLKPIITLNKEGKAILCDKAFSEVKGLNKLVTRVDSQRTSQTLDSYGLVHAGVPEKALQFAQLTQESFDQAPAFIEPVSTALGLHAGKGSIALACMMK